MPPDPDDTPLIRLADLAMTDTLAKTPLPAPYLGIAWMTLIYVSLVLSRRALNRETLPLICLLAGLMLVYLFSLSQLGIRWIAERLSIFVFGVLALLLGFVVAMNAGRRMAHPLALGALALLLTAGYARVDKALELTPYMLEAR